MEWETEIDFRNDDLKKCFEVLKTMRSKRELCDVTFQMGSTSISAHRVVIAASMPYFRKSFQDLKEDAALKNIDPKIFEYFVEYSYSQKMKINMENARDLLSGACYFRVEEVKDACCDFLSDRLQPESVIRLRDLACRLHCWSLLENTDRYIRENFVAVSKTEDFLNVPLLYVKALLDRDDLLVSNEEKVFDAVMKWIKASTEERKDSLPELLRKVRLPLLKLDYLTDTVGQEELIRTSIPCRDLLDEAKNCHWQPERKQKSCSFSSRPRCLMQQVGSSQNEEKAIYNLIVTTTYTVECFEENNRGWKNICSGNVNTNACAFAPLNNEIYFFHGDKSVVYTLQRNSVRGVARMPSLRSFAAAVSLKNKIFVCGGSIETTALNVVESFDPQTEEWTSLSTMRRRRAGLCTVALGDYIYAFGGTDYTTVHDSVERYDSKTNKWNVVSRMLTKRCIASAATLKGKIYVCGGDSSPTAGELKCIATAEVYDPNENTWRFISIMQIARCELKALSYCGKLYVLGGFDSCGRSVSAVEVYDPESDEWKFGPKPKHTETFLSCAVSM